MTKNETKISFFLGSSDAERPLILTLQIPDVLEEDYRQFWRNQIDPIVEDTLQQIKRILES